MKGLAMKKKDTPVAPTGAEESLTITFPENYAELTDEELSQLHDNATTVFAEIYGDGELSEEAFNELAELTPNIEAVKSELAAREEKAAERAAQAAELASKVGIVKEDEEAEGADHVEDDQDEEEDEGEDPEEDEAVEEKPQEEGASDSDSFANTRKQFSVNRKRALRKAPKVEDKRDMKSVAKAATELAGYTAGQGVDWNGIGEILDRRLGGYSHSQFEAAKERGKSLTSGRQALATFSKTFSEKEIIDSDNFEHVESVLNHVASESRLKGGSLVAAGGWCAPSETMYDLCELESRDGLVSLPEFGVKRGGVRFTKGPDFSTIFENIGWNYTEAEDIAGDYDGAGGGTKPCYEIPCPEFEEIRLNAAGLCVKGGLLQSRGYPEVGARIVRGALVAHEHKMAARKISGMEAGSDAVTMREGTVGTIAPILTAIELQVEHMKYKHRLARNASMEAVFPYWVRGAIRSDLALRSGVDTISVSDAQINQWFSARNISPQFVYNWQDVTGEAAAFTAWPTEVQFLLYPAGTWMVGTSDILTVDTEYSTELLSTNDFTALWTEEGWLLMKRCYDSRLVTVPICPSGATSAPVELACDGTKAAGV